MAFDPSAVGVGDRLPDRLAPPVNRTTLALFAGASGDHHPIHIDIDYAKAAGMPDVFAHGMLVMAWLGQAVTDWAGQARLRKFTTRFMGITQLGDEVRCGGEIVELLERDGEPLARIALTAIDQFGNQKLGGEALVSLSPALGRNAQ